MKAAQPDANDTKLMEAVLNMTPNKLCALLMLHSEFPTISQSLIEQCNMG
jgi:hypothetical protein